MNSCACVVLAVCCALLVGGCSAKVEVTKIVKTLGKNTYEVAVKYRLSGDVLAGAPHDVGVVDSLPEELELLSGSLVARVPKRSATTPASWEDGVKYVVRASRVEYTAQETERRVALPEAKAVVFSEKSVDDVLEEGESTEAAEVVAELALPKARNFAIAARFPWLIPSCVGAATIAFPALVALIALAGRHGEEAAKIKTK